MPAISTNVMDPAHDPEVAKSHSISCFQEKDHRDREDSGDSSPLDSSVYSEYGRYCDTVQVDLEIANTHANNDELKGRDAVVQFFEQARKVKNLSSSYEWIGSLPRKMKGEAVPLFTDKDTETDYQLHFSYTWIDALHTAPLGSFDDFVHSLLHATNGDNCEVVRNPYFVIPIGRLFVNESGCSNWTGYEVFVSSSLEVWIIYGIDEVDPEKLYPVECSLSSCTISANEREGHVQTEKWPSFKIARIWSSLQSLAYASFEEAAAEIRISHSNHYMGSFYLLQVTGPDAPRGWSLADKDFVRNLVTGKLNVNAESSAGRELLSLAYENADKAIIELKYENRHQQKESDNQVLILLAAKAGDETIIQLLLATGKADTDSKDSKGRTALSWAAAAGHEAIVSLLLATEKAEVDSKDSDGWTPLLWAARMEREDVVGLLLATNKADINSKFSGNQTLLLWAAACRKEGVVRLLLATGKADIDSKDSEGRTALSWAAAAGHEAIVSLLLATSKADIKSEDNKGRTPLSWAIQSGNEAVARLLLTTGKADLNSKTTK